MGFGGLGGWGGVGGVGGMADVGWMGWVGGGGVGGWGGLGGWGGVGGVVGGWGAFFFFLLFGTQQLTLGTVDLFVFFGPKTRRFLSNLDFGEIDFTNDRLKLKINVNPTSWDYSRPF